MRFGRFAGAVGALLTAGAVSAAPDTGLSGPVVSGAAVPDKAFYTPMVTGLISAQLIDPQSAIYEWSDPYQMTCRKGVYHTPERWKGWAVDVNVNAKNRLGGYTGRQLYTVIFTTDVQQTRTEVLDGRIFWMFHSCKREAWQ